MSSADKKERLNTLINRGINRGASGKIIGQSRKITFLQKQSPNQQNRRINSERSGQRMSARPIRVTFWPVVVCWIEAGQFVCMEG